MEDKRARHRAKLKKLRTSYAAKLPRRLNELAELVSLLVDSPTPDKARQAVDDVHAQAHKLSGSAGTFGYAAVSDAAHQLEVFSLALLDEGVSPTAEHCQKAEELLSNLIVAGNKPQTDNRTDRSAPEEQPSVEENQGKTIIVVEDDEHLLEHLSTQLSDFDFNVESLLTPTDLRKQIAITPPSAVIMDISFPDGRDVGLDTVRELESEGALACPVVYMTGRSDFDARLTALRNGCDGYITKPIDTLEMVRTLQRLTIKEDVAPYRILIVEDDEDTAEYYGLVLNNAGMETCVLTDPSEIMSPLMTFKPELILTDINMPHCDGLELAALVRQIPTFLQVPIVFLTSEESLQKRIEALQAGGSEFLKKPVSSDFLLSSVLARVSRSRLLSSSIARLEESEERFRSVTQAANAVIISSDEQGRILFANASTPGVFGYTPTELTGKPLSLLIPERTREKFYKDFQEFLSGDGKSILNNESEFIGLHKNGREFPVEVSLSSWTANDKRYFASVIHDISERKKVELALSEKVRELDSQKFALDEHAIVSIADVKGNITYVNDKFCTISGYSREELLGKNHRILRSDEHAPEFYADLWGTIANGKVWNGKIRNLRKDGGSYWVEATIVPFLNNQGKPFQYVAIRTDITERVKAKEEADRANQAKSEFLSSMSHELRTPMNAILGFGQMLEFNPQEPLTESQKECVDHIMRGGQYLLELINDVLDLAQIEAGKVTLSIEDISPADILEECLSMISAHAEKRGITLPLSCVTEDVPKIRADHTRFKQVLLNLLSNAVKYNRENGTVSIHFEETSDTKLRISVTDTGIGIPEDKHDVLFKPFSRLGAENSEIEGTGIGLVVCKDLVELMDGTIDVESKLGKGTTFWIELPLATVIDHTAYGMNEVSEMKAKGLLPGIGGTLLYVEDNPANLKLMELIVSRIDGLSLISAHTGELGIELARAEKPDIIILDINLPGMNGIEVFKQLQGYETTKNIPVMALSAAATARDIETGTEAGFLHYLTKPIKVPEVVESIKNALEAHK